MQSDYIKHHGVRGQKVAIGAACMRYYDKAKSKKNDSLSHHGILGQKWGIRRFQNRNGRLTPAGREHVAENKKSSGESERTVKKGLTPEQKKAIAIGAAAVGTALAAYGGYKLYQANKKATEGLSQEYHNKAVDNFAKARSLQAKGEGIHDEGFKLANKTGSDSANKMMTLGTRYMNEASNFKGAGEYYQDKAKNKKYSVSEKIGYLKGKGTQENTTTKAMDYNAKVLAENTGAAKSLYEAAKNKENNANLNLRKINNPQANDANKYSSANATKSNFKTTFGGDKSYTSKNAASTKSVNEAFGNIKGQQKFNNAASANEALISDLLKKNASMLANF